MKLFDVYNERQSFVMRAPMVTIARVFNLERDGMDRIERETADGGHCIYHSKTGTMRLQSDRFIFMEAGVGEIP